MNMKKIALFLLAAAMILTLAVTASAYWEPEEAFGEVKFTIGKQSVAWNADGTITDGEYYKVEMPAEWISYAINDNDTDAGLEYAKATHPELYMSWDENYIYTATKYEVTKGHENLWDGDPASMWYSGAVQFNYANFDEVASEYRLEYGVGLSSDTGDTLYTVWADGCGSGYTPSQDDAKVWLNGNTLTYETRVPWDAFADEDNTAGKEGLGFNFCLVWSIGEGQDYVHLQLAEGCTGNGKHAENFAQVTLGPAQAAAAAAAPAAESPTSAAVKIEKPEEMEYPTFNPLENSGEGFPTNSNPDAGDAESPESLEAALKAAADSIGKTPLTGVYSFVDASAGYNEQEGGASLWDGVVRTKWAGNEMPFINIAQLDGKYKFDGIIMATANDTASYDRNPMEWAVYGSNDGINWDPICYGDDSFFELTNVTYYAGAFDKTEKAYELVLFYSDVGGVSGFQISELVMCGERAGDATLNVNKDEANKWADLIKFDAGDPIANNGASYEDEAAALASIGGTSINDKIVEFSVGGDKGKTPGFAGEEAEKLWDSDNTTKYCSTYVPETSIIEMDGTYGLNGIVMSTANDNSSNPGRNPDNWAILGSNDLENWTVLVNGNDTFFEDVDYTYYAASFDMTGGYKYFAFENLSTKSGTFQLAEVVLIGAPADEAVAAPVVSYPSSGADGDIINGTVIGNAEGWGGNADAGAAAAFDGNPATFFDPLGVGDGFCGIDAGESYILDKVVILSRADWNARFPGAMIQGSNDGENWTTLWTSDVEGTNPDYYTVTEFENNTGYSQFRYFNETNHGDVAEVEFYGKPGSAAPAPGFGTADEAVASIGKTAISGYTFTEGSNGNNNEGPENIWDGDTATKFCTGEFPISSVAELDDWYKIDGIVMATANDNAEYNGRLPSAWTVSGSPDGENWTVIASGDESFFEESDFRYFAGDASSDAIKFVKFDADGASSGCFQISELVLTGSKTAAPAADEALDAKEEAPNTFDFGVIAAIAAVVSLGGFAVSKKRH